MQGLRYLKKPGQFAAVYSGGRSWASGMLVVRKAANGLDISRYGFSVGKRVGGAVVRNRVKRRLREIMRRRELKGGWDVVIIARAPSGGSSFRQLREEMDNLLCGAGMEGAGK